MKKLKGLWKLLRFELPFSAGICVVLGQIFALGKFAPVLTTLYGFLSVFLISASILVLNDYFDVETDMVNSPHRPIPAKLVSPSEALIFSIFLLLAGLVLSSMTGIITLIISIILAVIGFLYNRYFKKSGLFGNLLVSFSVGMTFIYGGATVGSPLNEMVIFFAVIAALVDLGEEIAADATDIKGDLLIRSNSLAIKYGETFALRISAIIFAIVIILSLIPFILNQFSLIYLIPILIMDLIIIYSVIKLLKVKTGDKRKYIRSIYLGATFGLIIFLIMKLIGIE